MNRKYGVPYYCMTDDCKNANGYIISKINKEFSKLLSDNNINNTLEFKIQNMSYDIKVEPNNDYYPSTILVFSNAVQIDKFHPTQKPVDLLRYLVLTYTNEGDTVLDNCMGSGTTAIACIKERRHFIGFELSKEYFDKAVRRIKAEQAQLTLF